MKRSAQGMKEDTLKAHPCEILVTQKKEKIAKALREERQTPYKGLRLRVALDF